MARSNVGLRGTPPSGTCQDKQGKRQGRKEGERREGRRGEGRREKELETAGRGKPSRQQEKI
eukprot:1259577-Pyramimonas_sp.AAC.1